MCGWQPYPGPLSLPAKPLWSVSLRPQRGSVFRAALAVRALRFGRALRENRCSHKVGSAVIRLGRALIWMFGFLSPRSPALWKGVVFRLARRRSGSSCLCSAVHPARPADPHGARVPPALSSHPRAPALGDTRAGQGACLLVQSKITVGISPAELG